MIKLKDLISEYSIRPRRGTGVTKKEQAELQKAIEKVWKKFRSLGGGYVEMGSVEMFRHPTRYGLKFQIARKQKSGKHRDWIYFKLDKKNNVVIQPKGRKEFKAGNLSNPNGVAKILNKWSDENLLFDK